MNLLLDTHVVLWWLAPSFAHGISLDEPAGPADVDVEEVQ
jgi:PIN domain nuclease of toxin-antitoxin system